jgi:hypothetical protein
MARFSTYRDLFGSLYGSLLDQIFGSAVDNWISCPFNFEVSENLSVQFHELPRSLAGFALSFGCGEHYWLSLKSEI